MLASGADPNCKISADMSSAPKGGMTLLDYVSARVKDNGERMAKMLVFYGAKSTPLEERQTMYIKLLEDEKIARELAEANRVMRRVIALKST